VEAGKGQERRRLVIVRRKGRNEIVPVLRKAGRSQDKGVLGRIGSSETENGAKKVGLKLDELGKMSTGTDLSFGALKLGPQRRGAKLSICRKK